MTAKIVLLNGPPRAGKDTLAAVLATQFHTPNINKTHSAIAKFAAPLKIAAAAIYCGMDQALFSEMDSAEKKDTPSDLFLGKTCREVQIGISEVFAKPFHGEQVFGKMLANNLKRIIPQMVAEDEDVIFFISDSGFRQEAEVLVEAFGADNVVLVRIHREGYDYSNDSRNYIELNDLGVATLDVKNLEGAPSLAVEEVSKFINDNLF